jgi:hypothetical protein
MANTTRKRSSHSRCHPFGSEADSLYSMAAVDLHATSDRADDVSAAAESRWK